MSDMLSNTLIISKIIGTVSIGALTGTLATTSNVSLPSLLLTAPKDASLLLKSITCKTLSIVKSLSIIAFSSLTISYVAASPSGRHLYLLYSALLIPISLAGGYFKGFPVYSSLSNLLESQASSNDKPGQKQNSLESKRPLLEDSETSNSNLESSVYNITKSDLEPDYEVQTPVAHDAHEISTTEETHQVSTSDKDSNSAHTLISDHVSKLVKYTQAATAVAGTAFLIVTFGIYGDLY